MEINEGEKKKPAEGDKSTKRKMKTASQIQLLEKTYAVATYPSEAMRAELSAKLGLTDRQLQMWFCHRRLKDRKDTGAKRPRKDAATAAAASGDEMAAAPEPRGELGLVPAQAPALAPPPPLYLQGETRRVAPQRLVLPRVVGDMPVMKRYYEPPQSISELRAIAFVESQLGEPLREDGPVLGVEFDPLPPDAFGAPLEMTGQQNQAMRPYESKMFERQDAKPIKTAYMPSVENCLVSSSSGGKRKSSGSNVHAVHPQTSARTVHEYQFLPEQPVRSDTCERVAPSHLHDNPVHGVSGRTSSVGSGGPFLHGNEHVGPGYNIQPKISNVFLSQQGRQKHAYSSGSAEYDNLPQKNSLMNVGTDAQFGAHPIIGLENPFVPSNRHVSLDEDTTRIERKRKSEEARIAKEVEAHEKRIRKELEKQDILRRKREEQMRREMERHDRERRKEEERLLREKQREEERFQREQRREHERRERFLQKETIRAEKMRQKEELRREKEAARLKAANERATARRLAKESMELIEDSRLELMECAAFSRGLPSIIALDSDTLENLDVFKDMLRAFPSKSVSLRRPFALHPWIDSEENVGNLLMVWRFLITFADAIDLWPFTLDEFVQSFHDYDPRLLAEVHIALLKSIIKDIEDVARTPSVGLGAGQNSAANPGGGHPQIVEGAYAWGFDIRSWQHHLNALTWPEVLRQFSLCAGFGPRLKKRSVPQTFFRDDNEGQDGEDIVTTLRNGAAAENAVAIMQEKGYSNRRRSRHRLTPGTVKFAAFHVLSLEGSKGLTILEVADKIQKSGLRDLTTSKTPEASIAAALSRDTMLFERTAPSTYCVRAPFRKDPANADAILSAAREKVQFFQSRFSDSEEGEKDADDGDDVERDDESESDDPEVDDLGSLAILNKEVAPLNGIKGAPEAGCSINDNAVAISDNIATSPNGLGSAGKSLSSFPLEGSKDGATGINGQTLDVAPNCQVPNADQDDTEIDESNTGEAWVQGLMEGDYSDLSVEERLHALVALIGVAIEGNSIRIILEERLEAANALKKQMWAEAQLDKRRMKEEYMTKFQYTPYMGTKAETNLTVSAVDGNYSPSPGIDNKINEMPLNHAAKQELFSDSQTQNSNNTMPIEKSIVGHEFSTPPENFPVQQYNYAAEKSRSQLKSYIAHRAEEMYVYRSLPLGQDRRRNRYWLFATSSSRNDPGSGRIFFESHDGCWRLIDSVEAFDALLASLDTRGIRESHLYSMLQKIELSFKATVRRNACLDRPIDPVLSVKEEDVEMASSADCSVATETLDNIDILDLSVSFKIEIGRNDTEKINALQRYQDLQKWLWKECFNTSVLYALRYGKKRSQELLATCDACYIVFLSEEKHCPSCHKTLAAVYNLESKFSEHFVHCERRTFGPNCQSSRSTLPARFHLLKAQLALIEASIPTEALQPFWTDAKRKSWAAKLHSSSSADDLFQLLTLFEFSVKRDCLSSNFETTKELLGSSITGFPLDEDDSVSASVPVLPWVPLTTAAVALRLMEFDASISYMMQQKGDSHKDMDAGEFFKFPSRYAVVKNIQEPEPAGTPEQAEIWMDHGSGRNLTRARGTRGRGRGGSRGGRCIRGSGSSRAESARNNLWSSGKSSQKQGRRPRTRGRGRRRGRRTVRRRQKPVNKAVKEVVLSDFGDMGHVQQMGNGESPRSSGGEEWEGEETGRMYVESEDNSPGLSESDDNGQASGDEYDEQGGADYAHIFDDKSEGLMDDSEENDDGDEEEDVDAEEGNGGGIDDDDDDVDDDVDVDDEDGDGVAHEVMDEDDDGDEGNVDEDEENVDDGNGDEDEGTASLSTDYSD